MSDGSTTTPAGRDPALPWDLLDRGDPAFVDRLRAIHDGEALADFALGWYQDDRPASRRLLAAYLDRPLDAFRHEGLVKRLFKLAEVSKDDATMARFLVGFDRAVRRVRRRKPRQESRRLANLAEAESLVAEWKARGFRLSGLHQPRQGGMVQVIGYWPDEVIRPAYGTTLPPDLAAGEQGWDAEARRMIRGRKQNVDLNWMMAGGRRRLFSVRTRKYLRRRAWRYFRNLGRREPERYVAAVSRALMLYRDEDAADGLALLDNWGLVHALFHHSPALEARSNGWVLSEGSTLADVGPAPAFAELWDGQPRAVVELLNAPGRAVRQWAIRRIREHPEGVSEVWPVSERIDVLGHADPDVVALAEEWLRGVEGLDALGFDRWLELVLRTSPASLDLLADLVRQNVRPDDVTTDQMVDLATMRPVPLARLGLHWLRTRPLRDDEADEVLVRLLDAPCPTLRPEILAWLRGAVGALPSHRADRLLRWLDSRHADARAMGWLWFLAEPELRDDVEIWRKVIETPYDDVQLNLIAELERQGREAGTNKLPGWVGLDRALLRPVWAAVLLNVHRGHRIKPVVVAQLRDAVGRHPEAAAELLPLLGVALRSARPPERRAGLVALVRLVEAHPEVEPLAKASFPELAWSAP